MSMTDTQRTALAAAYAAAATHGSLHSADPAPAGASEVVRGALTWTAVTGTPGTYEGVADLVVPSGTTVTHGGLWSGASGGSGTYRDGKILPASFTGPGTYRLTVRYTQLAG